MSTSYLQKASSTVITYILAAAQSAIPWIWRNSEQIVREAPSGTGRWVTHHDRLRLFSLQSGKKSESLFSSWHERFPVCVFYEAIQVENLTKTGLLASVLHGARFESQVSAEAYLIGRHIRKISFITSETHRKHQVISDSEQLWSGYCHKRHHF